MRSSEEPSEVGTEEQEMVRVALDPGTDLSCHSGESGSSPGV